MIGFPERNARNGKAYKGKKKEFSGNRGQKWSKGGRNGKSGFKAAANASASEHNSQSSVPSMITPQQLEQLMKLLPTPSEVGGSETEDEMDYSYAGMVSFHLAETIPNEWIIDSGASHHMTGCVNLLEDAVRSKGVSKINLPTGDTSLITHYGTVKLKNNVTLANVMVVPGLKHNLLSVQKLAKDENCKVNFQAGFCIIQDSDSSQVRGVGRAVNGLYYLINKDTDTLIKRLYKKKTLISNKEEKGLAMNAGYCCDKQSTSDEA